LPEIADDSYFESNGIVLNKSGNQIIYSKLLQYLKTLDDSIEIDVDDSEEKDTGNDDEIQMFAQPGIAKVTDKAGTITLGKATPGKWQDVMAYLISKGLTKEGAAGVAGNMKIESNFNPGAIGDHGTSYGICQWHATRKTALFNFAKSQGKPANDMNVQLDYLWKELTSSYAGLIRDLKTTTDPRDAAHKFAAQFERPAHISNKRLDYAQQYSDTYGPSFTDQAVDAVVRTGIGAIGAWNSLKNIATDMGIGTVPLSSAETLGFATGKVDSGKVVGGGTGGNWGGSMPRALRIAKIANDFMGKNVITSQKRTRVQTANGNTSDHNVGVANAYAVDLACRGAQGDALLAHLMKAMGHPEYKGGKWFNVNKDGYRYQFGWKVPDHFDHIHVGVKKL
jgi:hypothetical protein